MTGPNDKCPCGSGKKYKRCCQQREEAERQARLAEEAALASPPPDFDDEFDDEFDGEFDDDLDDDFEQLDAPPGRPLSAYRVQKILEHPATAEIPGLRPYVDQLLGERWTTEKLAAMGTEEIEAKLRSFGVAHSRERFLSIAEARHSAWSISELWLERDPVTCRDSLDEDFLGLAAMELWKRWLPERPSREMLDEWIEEGYGRDEEEDEDPTPVCEPWWKAWQALQPRLTPAMRTMNDAEDLLDGMVLLFDWLQDFARLLTEAAAAGDTTWAQRGVQFTDQWIAQFYGDSDGLQVDFRVAKAQCLDALGEREKAVGVLRATIERWPKIAGGYLGMADQLSRVYSPDKSAPDYAGAIAALNQGLAKVTKGVSQRAELQERLERMHALAKG